MHLFGTCVRPRYVKRLFFKHQKIAFQPSLPNRTLFAAPQIASIGDVTQCTFLSNAATTGPAVYAFNCAGRINTNAFANEPFDAVRFLLPVAFLTSASAALHKSV